MKKFFLLLHIISLTIQAVEVSDNMKISLLTADPGEELYSVFGHSALRMKDSTQNIDIVFNYGTFDFSTPNFYVKFARGKLDYLLSAEPFPQFMSVYYIENRLVYEQILNLSIAQKEHLLHFLVHNMQPENRAYKYDFFYDNCATRLRDIFAADSTIHFSNAFVREKQSFRDLYQSFLPHMPWSCLGIDLALGMPADLIASAYDYMYIPQWLKEAVGTATNNNTPFVLEEKTLLAAGSSEAKKTLIHPLWVMWTLFILGGLSIYNKKMSAVFDAVFFIATGLLGLLIFFLWFFTDHSVTQYNLNLFWALPTHIVYAFFILHKPTHAFTVTYSKAIIFIAALFLVLWKFNPQEINIAVIPLLLTIILKATLALKNSK